MHSDDLLGGARLTEEAVHGIRDGDDPAGGAREGSVDMSERPEQIAVVVVPRRDDRDRSSVAATAP